MIKQPRIVVHTTFVEKFTRFPICPLQTFLFMQFDDLITCNFTSAILINMLVLSESGSLLTKGMRRWAIRYIEQKFLTWSTSTAVFSSQNLLDMPTSIESSASGDCWQYFLKFTLSHCCSVQIFFPAKLIISATSAANCFPRRRGRCQKWRCAT